MATLDDVRDIALSLTGVYETTSAQAGGLAWRTRAGLVVWERAPRTSDFAALEALGRTWPGGIVIGVRTDGLAPKEALVRSYPDVFFTTPHFDGYPAALVRLEAIGRDQLTEVVTDAWLTRVPARASTAWLAAQGGEPTA